MARALALYVVLPQPTTQDPAMRVNLTSVPPKSYGRLVWTLWANWPKNLAPSSDCSSPWHNFAQSLLIDYLLILMSILPELTDNGIDLGNRSSGFSKPTAGVGIYYPSLV
ncbi:1170_t:CDS:2, partial [Acaulospora colombiana]